MSNHYMPALFTPDSKKWNLFPLLFSLFYFLPIFFISKDLRAWEWISMVIAYFGFIGLYLWGLNSDSKRALAPILAILILCCLVTYITPGSNALFGFATFLGGYYFTLKRALLILGLALGVEVLAFVSFVYDSPVYFGIAAFLSVALFINAVLLRKDRLHRCAEQRSQSQIQQLAAIAERERISRDLHDIMGHSLSSIALKAELADKLIQADDPKAAAKEIASVAELTRRTLSEVRESVSGLKQRGLRAELDKLCSNLQSAGFDVQYDNELSESYSLPAEVESSAILLLKEASTNILRHSNGNRARLQIVQDQDALLITVWDNGQSTKLDEGNGIQGMRERCHSLGGELRLQYDKSGTLISFTVPKMQSELESST